jgi:hypothetical protein
MQVVPQSYRMIEVEMQKSVFRFIKDVSPWFMNMNLKLN